MNVTRAQIAAVLDTVPGINGYDKRPPTLKVGDAFPLVASWTRGPAEVWVTTWRVLVVMPTDERTAVDQAEALLPALAAALDAVAFVDAVRPLVVPTDAGDLPVLEITARSD